MTLDEVLFGVMVLLAASAASLLLFRRAGFGSVLALLATGMVLGPYGVGLGAEADDLRQVTELGVVFLLFLIGLEMRPSRLWSMRRVVLGLGTAQVLLTAAILAVLLHYLAGVNLRVAVLLGLGFALSSTAFVMQLLHERSEVASRHGQTAFGILLLQDLAVVPMLALVPLLSGRGAGLEAGEIGEDALLVGGMLGVLVVIGRWVIPKALELGARQRNMEAFATVAGLAVIGSAWAMHEVGLSMALGAFVMGMLLSGSSYVHQIAAELAPFKGVLLSLFFVSVGATMQLDLLLAQTPQVLALLVLLLAVKVAVLFVLSRLSGLDRANALRVALLLPQGGEFAFVLFGAAAASGAMSQERFQLSLLVLSLSMAVTPLLARLGDRLAARYEEAAVLPEPDWPGADLVRHVVIAGFGRVGRTIAFMLEQAEIPYVAVDLDVRRVALGRREGRPVHFGASTDMHVLDSLGVGRAAAVVVTLDNVAAVEAAVTAIRNLHPEVPIMVRARDLAVRDRLLAAGANEAIPETIELSTSLAAAVMLRAGAAEAQVDAAVESVRQDNYAALRLGAIRERMAEVEKGTA